MKYIELISKRRQYKYSANLIFDLADENRLAGFIPNVTTTEILREYLYSIIENINDVHSRILYGSYGTGKSHLLTVLSAILGHINTDSNGFDELCNSLSKYDSEFVNFLRRYSKEDKPFLVVPVYSDFDEFDKCISFSLKKEMDKNHIDIRFKNYFYDALEVLNTWEAGEESLLKLNDICIKKKINLKNLRKGLENYDLSSEREFSIIFETMTYGATFKSEGGSMLENIELVNEAIKHRYRGIVFVFDEFGRYVEDCGESIKVKSIQDLAEFCDHSSYNNYLLLVSHKQLSLYTDKMKKSIAEEWKKVEGRFKATSINIKYDQCLSLISHIIPKNKDAWDKFREKYEQQLNELYDEAYDFKGFLITSTKENEKPFEGGYPLHPITLYSLDRLSKRVAQNERTFFTYLAGDENNTLFSYLASVKDDGFHFVGLDAIYDYFEPNIRSFRSDEVYSIYKKLQYAINKLGGFENIQIDIKILKTIAVINIIGDMSILAADGKTLCNVIDEDKNDIKDAIKRLEELRVIKFMRQFNYYDFLDSSIFDLDAMVDEKLPHVSDEMAITTLNTEFNTFVVYPHEYNTMYHINRIFAPVFVQKSELNKKSFSKNLTDYYDGIIAFVIDRDYDELEYKEIRGIPERTIVVVGMNSVEVLIEVKRYWAIKYYYSRREELKKDDPTVEKELVLFLEEQKAIINDLISEWKNVNQSKVSVYINGEKKEVCSARELSKEASKLMCDAFNKTIVINNDLINKNFITGAMKIARNKVIDCLIDGKNVLNEVTPLSPEHSVFRSVLQRNGLYDASEKVRLNMLPSNNNIVSGEPVREVIHRFLKSKAIMAQTSINELYDELKRPPYGLRDGYISILLANELRSYGNVSLYFHGNERDYSTEELQNALEAPEDYALYISNWSDEQSSYIEKLENIFNQYINKGARNRLKELYNAMNRHFAGITKAARTTDRFVSEQTKKYREILSITSKDYHKFFFETLLVINEDYQDLLMEIRNIKRELEKVIELQRKGLLEVIKNVLSVPEKTSIVAYIIEKYESDWIYKKNRAFDYATNSFLDYVENVSEDKLDDEFACDLAKLFTGFEIEYWNDNKIDEFTEQFATVINQLDEYEIHEDVREGEIKITIQNGDDESKVSQFSKQELSSIGQMMYNKMRKTISDFGQSVSSEEKMQIVVKILSEII